MHTHGNPAAKEPPATTAWRLRMVAEQLVARGIRDARVLDAFRRVPRHLFCPPETPVATAYGDHPLDIGQGQTISQPLMVAEMTAWLRLEPHDKVLEIGTGSGYQAAILALLVAEVHTVERLPDLAESAQERLAALGFANIHVHVGDGSCGWPEQAPYDAIVVTAASPGIPDPLKEELAEGGILAIPVGPRFAQDLALCERRGKEFRVTHAGGCRFVPLIGQHGWQDGE